MKLNKNIKSSSGFTLIELLVVIAIIGILSSVVLASLNAARSKGSNAAVKSNLQGIRSQAEIVFDDDGNYANVCTNGNVIAAIDAAVLAGGDQTSPGVFATAADRCYTDGSDWVVNVMLKEAEGANDFWCTDHSGRSIAIDGPLDGSTFSCP